jgi:tryptophan synthase beta subunit
MKLEELSKEPKLTKITIDDEILVEKYGEAIEFWIYDRVDMSTFMKLASLEGEQNISDVVNTMKELILDEKGNQILSEKKVLPNDVMIKAVEKTVVALGNFATPTSKT